MTSSQADSPARLPWTDMTARGLGVIAGVAAVPRVLWLLVASRSPVGLFDPQIYLSAAQSIAAGNGYRSLTGTVTTYYPPGYPFFLGAIYWVSDLLGLTGRFFTVVAVIQGTLGVLAVLGVAVIATRIAGTRAGMAAGLVVALWPNLILHTTLLLSETLFIAISVAVVLGVMMALDHDGATSYAWIGATGIASGLAVLTRPQSGFFIVPVVMASALVSRFGWRHTLRVVGVLLAGLVLVVAPWTARNAAVMGSAVLVSTNVGDNICIGFNPDANGGFAMAPACQAETSYTDGPAEEVSRDAELKSKSISWARNNLRRVPGLSVSKLRITFEGDHDALRAAESFDQDRFLASWQRSALRWVSDLYYWAIAILGIAGVPILARLTRSKGESDEVDHADYEPQPHNVHVERFLGTYVVLTIAVGALVPMLSFGDQRFKVPVEPFIAILAALTLSRLAPVFLRSDSTHEMVIDA